MPEFLPFVLFVLFVLFVVYLDYLFTTKDTLVPKIWENWRSHQDGC